MSWRYQAYPPIEHHFTWPEPLKMVHWINVAAGRVITMVLKLWNSVMWKARQPVIWDWLPLLTTGHWKFCTVRYVREHSKTKPLLLISGPLNLTTQIARLRNVKVSSKCSIKRLNDWSFVCLMLNHLQSAYQATNLKNDLCCNPTSTGHPGGFH